MCVPVVCIARSLQPVEPGAVSDIPLHVINNYFSIGADASVALELHLGRGACSVQSYLHYGSAQSCLVAIHCSTTQSYLATMHYGISGKHVLV